MNNHRRLLQLLFNETTLIKVIDNQTENILFEEQITQEFSPISLQFKSPYDFSQLEINWNNKWDSFGNLWTDERQSFRYLWYEMRAFYQSYILYQENFSSALNLSFETDKDLRRKRNQLDLRAELAIRSMSEYGKQAIDLLISLSRTNSNIDNIVNNNPTNIFLNKFKETRNKFIVHYNNPRRFGDMFFEANYFSLTGTGSLFEIEIHIRNQAEHRYSGFINHYADYFMLEDIFVRIIQSF